MVTWKKAGELLQEEAPYGQSMRKFQILFLPKSGPSAGILEEVTGPGCLGYYILKVITVGVTIVARKRK